MNTNHNQNSDGSNDAIDRDALREAFRDGSVTPDQQKAFEAALKRDPQFADDVAAESRWLDTLAETRSDYTPADRERFTAAVLDNWAETKKATPLVRRSTLLLWGSSAAVAAVLAIVVTAMNYTNNLEAERKQQEANLPPLPDNVFVNPTNETYARLNSRGAPRTTDVAGDSVGVMLDEMHASLTTRPTEMLSDLGSRLTSIKLDRLPELAPMSVPDPADWLNHNNDETTDSTQAPA